MPGSPGGPSTDVPDGCSCGRRTFPASCLDSLRCKSALRRNSFLTLTLSPVSYDAMASSWAHFTKLRTALAAVLGVWLALASLPFVTPSHGWATAFPSFGWSSGEEGGPLCAARGDDGAPVKHGGQHSHCAFCTCPRDSASLAFLAMFFTALAPRFDSGQVSSVDREQTGAPIGRPSYSASRAPPSIG
ncbi:hypothetical protein [Methylosinus sp. KRF6]|uniref:hypothetical protein n=1 Tax=Methylosinus sp. KRF6 TaxID=2846853 RepID=UPI001C0DF3B3|nr:hypothetical protein [Methylosinus sp. KRF6]MBU3890816.1 hypothetical protein [Methylosinus sp. KRF6]